MNWLRSKLTGEAAPDKPEQSEPFIESLVARTSEQIAHSVEKFEHFPVVKPQRHKLASKDGGKVCADKQQVDKIRSVGGEMLKSLGKQLMRGDFNLTKVSFPIVACVPQSALENALTGTCLFPEYVGRACRESDPVQRFRLSCTAMTCYPYFLNMFLKPLNPILGETLVASYPDGTEMFVEQISHHPPISYFLVVGPKEEYRFFGYYHFEARPSLNSASLINRGTRTLKFRDGQTIVSNYPSTEYRGVFMGEIAEGPSGTVTFSDQANELQCLLTYGEEKDLPSDNFKGDFKLKGKTIQTVRGSPYSHMDFGTKRYFEGKKASAEQWIVRESELESDHSKRGDIQQLRLGAMEKAQEEKETLQVLQRHDAKLRKEYKSE